MFCGSGRGKFTRSTESFTEHPGEVEARRKEWKTRRGGGSTEESWKHGGFMEQGGELEARRRVGSTEESWKHGGFTEHGERSGKHGVFNGGILEDAQFYSILLCFYEAGKAHDYIFFLLKL